MILFHPLNTSANKKAIEKYKDRPVYLKIGSYGLWHGYSGWVVECERVILTFKEALKLTKFYKAESRIEYHFLDILGEAKPNIKDFDIEDVHNCPTISFQDLNQHSRYNG